MIAYNVEQLRELMHKLGSSISNWELETEILERKLKAMKNYWDGDDYEVAVDKLLNYMASIRKISDGLRLFYETLNDIHEEIEGYRTILPPPQSWVIMERLTGLKYN